MTDKKKWERFDEAHKKPPADDSDIFADDAVEEGESLADKLTGRTTDAEETEFSETGEVGPSPKEPAGIDCPSRDELESQLTAVEKQLDAQKALVLRLSAELENLRSRAERDISKAHRFGSESLLKDLIPVLDSLTRAVEGEPPEDSAAKALAEGIALTSGLLDKTIKKHGVEVISPEKGEAFDPAKHQAMSTQPGEGVDSGAVLMVLQQGYSLNGRVLRAAMVIVAQ